MSPKTALASVLSISLISCLFVNTSIAQKLPNKQEVETSIKAHEFFNTWKLLSVFSGPIQDDQATILINYYLHNSPKQTVNSSGTSSVLQSFTITTDQMRRLLAGDGSGTKPDQIVLALGVENAAAGKRWHLLFFGLHLGNIIVTHLFDGAINNDQINANDFPPMRAGDFEDNYYNGNKGADRWLTTNDYTGNLKFPLKGLSFAASQMDDIVNTNAYGSNPDKVIFKIGLKRRMINRKNFNEWHVIAYGQMNNGNLLNTSSNSSRLPSIYDKADPYPPR